VARWAVARWAVARWAVARWAVARWAVARFGSSQPTNTNHHLLAHLPYWDASCIAQVFELLQAVLVQPCMDLNDVTIHITGV
jgi:hypothetical protein